MISIDPGRKSLAWARWVGAHLVQCGLARTKATDLSAAAYDLAHQVPDLGAGLDRLVTVEEMVHYPAKGRTDARHRADAIAADLLDLQAIGGYVAGYLRAPVRWIPARSWKGQVPKEVTERRVGAILTRPERDILATACVGLPQGLRHNVIDAVGIGLFALGRKYTGGSIDG